MNNTKPVLNSFLHALAVVAYIALVAFIMNGLNETFSKVDQIHASIGILLLFTVSAAITGLLVFGRPVYLFLNDQKTEAIKFLFYTVSWLFIFTIVFLGISAVLA